MPAITTMTNSITRRAILTGCAITAVALPGLVLPLSAGEATMTAPEAHQAAKHNKVVFIDIRTPQEWQQTGIATTAHPVSMHKKGFLQKLDALIGGDKSRKIALICATGSRSAYIQSELKKRGYTNTISVAEGMIGGKNGKGWIPRGLPVKKPDQN